MYKSRIMVVDDEVVISMQLEEFLISMGYDVVGGASSGEDAISKARNLNPDLIIMDIVMPGILDGIDAAKIIKDDLGIPVLFLTAYGDKEYVGRAKHVGPIGYILKPFDQTEIMAAIEIALHKTAIEQQQKQSTVEMRKMSMAVERSLYLIITTDVKGNIEYVNPEFTRITGYTSEEVVGQNPRILKSGKTPSDEYRQLWKTITSGQEWRGEFCNKKKNGELYWYSASISPIKNQKGIITNFICVSENISERKKTDEIVKHMAYYDSLTNIPNRALFSDRLAMAIAYARRTKNLLAVMFLDLDGFKEVNDTHGHDIGDPILQKYAEELKECIREEDTVARVGGDEFMILLPRITKKENVSRIANKVIDIAKQPFKLGGKEFLISSSVGITMYPSDGNDADTLMKNADKCMYMAKEEGKKTTGL